jgi:two-component system NtrC family sensor kinase
MINVSETGEKEMLTESLVRKKTKRKLTSQLKTIGPDDDVKTDNNFNQDAIEPRTVEEELLDSQQFSNTLLNDAPNQVVVINPDSSIKYVNPSWEELNGWTRDEVIGLKIPYPWWWPEDQIDAYMAGFKQMIAGGPGKGEILTRKKNGELYWLSMTWTPVKKENQLQYMLVNSTDITEHKMTEKALQESEDKFRNLFEHAKDAILLADAETGILLDVNPAGSKLLGLPKDKLIGKHQTDIHPPEMADKYRQIFRKHVLKGKVPSEDTIMQRADGTSIPASVSASVFKLAGKTIIQGVFRDVSERKQAEEKLHQSEEFSSSLLKNAPNPISVINPDTTIRYINPSFEKLTGFTSTEVIGMKSPYPWWPDESKKKFESRLIDDLKGGSSVTEKQMKKKDGQPLWVHLSSTAVKQNGETFYLLVNWVDITERKQMEEKLIMQDRLASIGQLSSGLAHEINNPLTSIITFSTLLLQRELPDDIKEDIQTINDEAQRTTRVVKNLLTFARKQPQEKQLININEGIKKDLELRAYEQKVNNIRVNTNLNPNLPMILGNSSQLQQVFFNIIINAEYFMIEAHGKGNLNITTEKLGHYIRASFIDDGPGISKDDMRRLFTPFFTTKEVGRGTGLGLSICHGIITEHGGRIWADSEPGKGTSFVIELPVVDTR